MRASATGAQPRSEKLRHCTIFLHQVALEPCCFVTWINAEVLNWAGLDAQVLGPILSF